MQTKEPEVTGQCHEVSGGVDRNRGLVSDLSVCRLMPSPIGPVEASLAALAIVAIAPLVAHLAARLYAQVSGLGQAGVSVPGSIEGHLMAYEAVYAAALNIAMIGLTFAAVRRLGRPVAETLALNAPEDGWRAYSLSLLIAGLATVLWFVVLLQLMPDTVVADFLPYKEMMERERSWLMPPILCILAPAAEELLFRGFLFPALAKSRFGLVGAAIIVSAAWTSLHVDRTNLAVAQLFAAGLLLSWMLVRTGSLRVPILCHVLFNTGVSFMVIVLGIPG